MSGARSDAVTRRRKRLRDARRGAVLREADAAALVTGETTNAGLVHDRGRRGVAVDVDVRVRDHDVRVRAGVGQVSVEGPHVVALRVRAALGDARIEERRSGGRIALNT